MSFLKGKKALVLGVANDKSIATGITRAIYEQGGEIALTYQTERLQSRVEKLAQETGNGPTMQCDITNPEELASVVEKVKQVWGGLDIVVHAIAFAPREQLEGNYIDVTTKDGFLMAHDISAWSFTALAQAVKPILNPNASLLTLTYLGAVRAVPNYNIMGIAKASLEASVRYMAQSLGTEGIRVNGISAGPIRTLAASGIKNFRDLQDKASAITPLGRPVTTEEVGNTAAFLSSDLASGITGEIVYVDGGYNVVAGGA
jgi:enoyl-[acyl-carrier protein] reductase I